MRESRYTRTSRSSYIRCDIFVITNDCKCDRIRIRWRIEKHSPIFGFSSIRWGDWCFDLASQMRWIAVVSFASKTLWIVSSWSVRSRRSKSIASGDGCISRSGDLDSSMVLIDGGDCSYSGDNEKICIADVLLVFLSGWTTINSAIKLNEWQSMPHQFLVWLVTNYDDWCLNDEQCHYSLVQPWWS